MDDTQILMAFSPALFGNRMSTFRLEFKKVFASYSNYPRQHKDELPNLSQSGADELNFFGRAGKAFLFCPASLVSIMNPVGGEAITYNRSSEVLS